MRAKDQTVLPENRHKNLSPIHARELCGITLRLYRERTGSRHKKRGCLKSQLFKQPRKFGGRESAEFAREFRFLPLFSSISGEKSRKNVAASRREITRRVVEKLGTSFSTIPDFDVREMPRISTCADCRTIFAPVFVKKSQKNWAFFKTSTRKPARKWPARCVWRSARHFPHRRKKSRQDACVELCGIALT